MLAKPYVLKSLSVSQTATCCSLNDQLTTIPTCRSVVAGPLCDRGRYKCKVGHGRSTLYAGLTWNDGWLFIVVVGDLTTIRTIIYYIWAMSQHIIWFSMMWTILAFPQNKHDQTHGHSPSPLVRSAIGLFWIGTFKEADVWQAGKSPWTSHGGYGGRVTENRLPPNPLVNDINVPYSMTI